MKPEPTNAFLIADDAGNIFLRKNFEAEGRFELPRQLLDGRQAGAELPQFEELMDLACGPANRVKVLFAAVRAAAVPAADLQRMRVDGAVQMVMDGQIIDAVTVASILKASKLNLIRSELEILYQDSYCIAVNKPSGLLVHRTRMAGDNDFALQRLRDQINRRVYPIHRLDRQTSGVLLFGLSTECASRFFEMFRERNVVKTYIALVRGWTDTSGVIERPLKGGRNDNLREAVTEYERLATVELPIPVRPYDTSRYSLVKINLKTGRTHQIRRHFNSASHPVIGDTVYGDGCHNRMFREHFQTHRLMLMAVRLEFKHPFTGEQVVIAANPDKDFIHIMDVLGIDPSVLDDEGSALARSRH